MPSVQDEYKELSSETKQAYQDIDDFKYVARSISTAEIIVAIIGTLVWGFGDLFIYVIGFPVNSQCPI